MPIWGQAEIDGNNLLPEFSEVAIPRIIFPLPFQGRLIFIRKRLKKTN
jgi:hypothetical protein